jgi:LPS-assembly protein
VTGKFAQEVGAPDYRDLLYLKLSQGYQFSGERRDLLTLVDAGHRLTDLMLESTVTPMKGLSILADSRYNQVDGNLSTANLAVEVKGDERAMVHLGYRYSRGELDYLEGSFTFPVTSQYTAGVLERYSFDRGALLESRYSLEYKHQCWSIIAIFANRPAIANAPGNISNPGNTEFTVNFTLAGLGELGPVRAF